MKSRLQSIGRINLSLTAAAIAITWTGFAFAQAPGETAPAALAGSYEPATPPATATAPAPTVATPAPEMAAPVVAATPAPTAAERKEEKQLVGYDKGFFLTDPKGLFKLVIGARVQGRFTFENIESHKTNEEGADTAATEKEKAYQFSVPQARLKLSGHVFSERVAYQMQADFGNKGNPALIAAYGDFGLVSDVLYLRVGQWERPFSRQQITSSGSFHLVDRAITDKAFGAGRDLGVAFHNNYEKSPKLEWALGLFNGTGDKPWFEGGFEGTGETDADGNITVEGEVSSKAKPTNVPDKLRPAVVARIGFNTGKIKGYSEADLEGGPFRFGMAASVQADFDASDEGKAATRADLDFIMKVEGFSLDGAIYLASVQDGSGFADQKYGAWGLHAQAGYVIAGRVEPVVRYALVDLDGDDNNTQEFLGGLAIYVFKHNLKWQTEAGSVLRQDPAGTLDDVVVRTQLGLAF